LNVQMIPVADLKPYSRNAKKHPPEQVEHIANSIREFGWQQPIVVDDNNVVVIGHGRLEAAKKLNMETVPVVYASGLTGEQIKALRLADNRTNESEWDFELLDVELDSIFDIDMSDFGFENPAEEEEREESEQHISMVERYIVPPFSVIYGNKPDWQKRKHNWIVFGIRSEIGRGGDLLSIQGAIHRQTSYRGRCKEKHTQTD